MPGRPLAKYGQPGLRKRAVEIDEIDDSVRALAGEMFERLSEVKGVGLAAPQMGVPLRLVVLSIPRDDGTRWKFALVNPVLVSRRGRTKSEEGCLSVPGVYEEIERAQEVEVRGLDLDGRDIVVQGDGLLARALQHELDHLDGVLIVDRLSSVKRQALRRRLRKLEEEAQESAH
ncbi:MAG: peptide deformylase [Candidatus Eisenbacteria bacterium]